MKQDKATKKYFALYAEPEISLAESLNWPTCYQNALVIPALDESYEFISRLQEFKTNYNKDKKQGEQKTEIESSTNNKSVLLALIINQPNRPETADDKKHFTSNQELHRHVQDHGTLISHHKNLYLYDFKNIDILIVDRYSLQNRIPEKFGVGLARKIGADIAALLIEKKIVRMPLIFSSDADATLPKNYFSDSEQLLKNNHNRELSALVFNFQHQLINNTLELSDQVYQATKIYEQLIGYYAYRLQNAGSPYGFCSLGSCLAVTQKHYCQARGFPKKPAGEDFYLLNKLAKLGHVKSVEHIKVTIDARLSNRVPFGTGPAAEKILLTLSLGKSPLYYDPRSFDCLKNIIESITQITSSKQIEKDFDIILSTICNDREQEIAIHEGLSNLNINVFFTHIKKQSVDISKLAKAFHDWFDGFKTLKFIHYLTNHHYPRIPADDILKMIINKQDRA